MGLPDAYPFQIGAKAKTKLAFVHAMLNERTEEVRVAHEPAPPPRPNEPPPAGPHELEQQSPQLE